ncbi:PREDICTED: probable ATP-dependent RNA helicase DDX56 [Nicrophorus vespilloides]|uniref:RNA helicase n=1 Tax=Nicrophorus vespilloides TaxID=110193 RepID=A0ABM1MW39_NICVS|nr:PREDICTED: probable ATP-dependent RNA helicase DDX56 [Nicrophorus vespilloides]
MEEVDEKQVYFHDMELDDRILKAIAMLGWEKPTVIQETAIPMALEGKDLLIKARTGQGKTASFLIPVIQKVLTHKKTAIETESIAIILCPSRELCKQTMTVIGQLTRKCSQVVKCIDISPDVEIAIQKPLLTNKPEIIVSTPSKLLKHLTAETITLSTIQYVVIDEADLVFSFGYQNDIEELIKYLPQFYQAILASATLSQDVKDLKKLVLHNPVILKLHEADIPPNSQLAHYYIAAEELEKATILSSLYKLHLINGKSIVFVNSVDKCYKLKLFLHQFAVKACVLNSELPAAVRCKAVEDFNNGVYDTIIASDERSLTEDLTFIKKEEEEIAQDGEEKEEKKKKKRNRRAKDKESGVARGIDFQCVSNVINFELPSEIDSYIHRAGRTARGTNTGTVLSFINKRQKKIFEEIEDHINKLQNTTNSFKKYEFKMDDVASLQYRAQDAWNAVTKNVIKEARMNEIKKEIIQSKKLKMYFEANPIDLEVLESQSTTRQPKKIKQNLGCMPDYIVPTTLRHLIDEQSKAGTKSGIWKQAEKINKEEKKQKYVKSNMNDKKRSNPLETTFQKKFKN